MLVTRLFSIALAVFVTIALVGMGMYLGAHPKRLPTAVQNAIGVDRQQQVVQEAVDRIKSTYYRKIPDTALANSSIAGMVRSLNDRFSNYFSPEEYKKFKQVTNGQFSGVGMTVTAVPTGLRVSQTYADSPARKAGLITGDVIIAANGKTLKGRNENAATALIKGPPGTFVTLTWIDAHKKRITKRLMRSTVNVPVVVSKLRECKGVKVAVVGLGQFSSGAHAQVYAAIQKQLARGAKAIVLDLRGNGGGLVTEAQLVASAFLRDGPIVTTRGRNVATHTLNAIGSPVAPTQPLVVLVDKNSASASEIVSGALQDRKRATLVGDGTFGKGIFQEVIDLSNGGALDITAGQYFLPSGRNIGGKGVKQGRGLTPDVKTPVDDTQANAAAGLQTAICTAAKKV